MWFSDMQNSFVVFSFGIFCCQNKEKMTILCLKFNSKCGQCSLLLFQGVFHFFPIMPLAEIKHYSFNIALAHFIDCPLCQRSSCRYRLPNSGKINRKGGGYSVGLRGWTDISKNSVKLFFA